MKSIQVEVPASAANLGPGFDCLALALTLHNSFEFTLTDNGVAIENHGAWRDGLPDDKSNVVAGAFFHLAEQIGLPHPGVRIRANNQIPPGSGLGSSASAVVAGLLAANHLLGADLESSQLLNMAAELEGHADNAAAALFGGLVAVKEDDGVWRYIKTELPPLKVIVVVPNLAISTDQMRSALPDSLPTQQAVSNAASLAFMFDALVRADFDQMRWASRTSFHQQARLPYIPGGQEALSAGQSAGAAVMLSGAGPGMLALAPDHHSAVAAAMQDAFNSVGVDSEVYFLASRVEGAIILRQ